MNPWRLPTSLEINGVVFNIRTDFRAIIDILITFDSNEYEDDEKWIIAMIIFYPDFDDMDKEFYEEAVEKMKEFIDAWSPHKDDGKQSPKIMDWENDAQLIIPSVNKVVGKDVRTCEYMHWWTFMGAYMEIGDGVYQQVMSIRSKKSKHKKLEKWEQEFYKENKAIVDMKKKLTKEEQEKKDRLNKLLG